MFNNKEKREYTQPKLFLFFLTLLIGAFILSDASAFTVNLNVVGPSSYRWLVEEDTTNQPVSPFTPGDRSTLSFTFHKSYAPVVITGYSTNPSIALPDGKRYFVSVLPDSGYTIGGAPIADGQTSVTVVCNQLPLPTAQITVFVFEDNNPINNAPDQNENGLGGFQVFIEDAAGRYGMAGGQQMMDAFGNMIGTTYNPDGTVNIMGDGFVVTDADGMATVKNLAPGKYGVYIVPPAGEGWQQTTTIEGKKVIDAWVKANEPAFFTEFGPAGYHVFVGFVQPINDGTVLTGGKTITGQVVNLHTSRPPATTFYPGEPMSNCWVGLNLGAAGTGKGVYAAPCDPVTGAFSIPNVPNGSYQLVFWDKYLDNIFAFYGIVVDDAFDPNLGKIPVFRWFGTLENKVFYDANENGLRDADEPYILPEQAVNLRFRDGTVYLSMPTDMEGLAPFEEVFPFFHWLVTEVDFAQFKATGATFIVDDGGGPLSPGSNLVPQEQAGGALERTETGPVLTQAMQLFLGQTNVIEWGKKEYAPGENGGISGMVFYATTRAENDPRYAVGEEWEPGIPRVQVNLYADGAPCGTSTPDAIIDDLNGDGVVTLADVDNYPFGWATGGLKGDEDTDYNGNGTFDAGDAIQVTWTDSWDDSMPIDCPGDPGDPFYDANNDGTGGDCYDGLRNFNQLRPGVFDGGYAFDSYVPGGVDSGNPLADGLPMGMYIVEATVPGGYILVKEEDKNVDFGDTYTPSLLLLPPVCVGHNHTVPAELTLFAGIAAPYAGEVRPLCNMKQIELKDGLNAAADFFLYTEVPKAGRIVGIILNDLANEFDPNAPTFGEKFAPSWVPVSVRDYKGQEISRVYSDEYGAYNALVPSTYTTNLPSPSGMSPNMITVVLNDPFKPDGSEDESYNPQYSTFSYTFQYMPGTTTYLDTPVLPIAAFAGPNDFPLDGEFPDGTPVIKQVDGPGGGPYVTAGQSITIQSMGTAVSVRNPAYDGTNNQFITRDYGFGTQGAGSSVTIGGVAYAAATWDADSITVNNVTAGGPVVVTRDDGAGNPGKKSLLGITVTVGGSVLRVGPTQTYTTIQAAIDAAADGDLILVEPGVYDEFVIMYKDVKLQGYGAAVTKIRGFKVPAEKLQTWMDDIEAHRVAGDFAILPSQVPGPGLFGSELGPAIIVLAPMAGFNGARIDGFTISGGDQGGAIFVNGWVGGPTPGSAAESLVISNNRISGNQGFYGGGIRIGHPDLIFNDENVDAHNYDIKIRHNHITQNGGLNGAGGGISIHTGADNYEITSNYIVGNFTSGDGAGIGHLGRSDGGTIMNNTVIFNQSFNQGRSVSGGGILIAGHAPIIGLADVGPGSGSILVEANRIQGNQAGAGDGGGIALRFTNNDAITINNNLIVNNVTGLAGGGIALQDAVNVSITNNTVAHNDSTATASLAFTAGPLISTNQPAGVASRGHVSALAGTFSNPVSFESNIIWKNRTFSWDGGLQPDFATPDFWDLGVLGAAGQMNPLSGILTTLTGPDGATYDGSNLPNDPQFTQAYFNGARGALIIPEPTTGIQTAIAFDEGGNFIDIRFGPLTLGGDYTSTSGNGADGTVGILEFRAPSAGGGTTEATSSTGGGGTCFICTASSGSSALSEFFVLLLVVGGLAIAGLLSRRIPPERGMTMKKFGLFGLLFLAALLVVMPATQAGAAVRVQCPPDTDGIDTDGDGIVDNDNVCIHVAAGDGFINMADGKFQYIFGFSDVTDVPEDQVMEAAMLGATFPAPTITVKEGQKLYLTLTNVGMIVRPDLFDPHTVHWHGFPNAATIFDGVPSGSISINMGSSLTYFYNLVEPGTYMWHCHVEATEHMQMGMLGQIYVTPKQNGTEYADPDGSGRSYTTFAYNDGDGSTGYDREYHIQISAFDPAFHDASYTVQPLPFALMDDKYPMLNGRGYPDTVNNTVLNNNASAIDAGYPDRDSQGEPSLIEATQGEKILLRLSSLSTVHYYTLTVLGIPMKVVGRGARILRGPDGKNLFYETTSVNLGGGEAVDVILDMAGVEPGTYFLYTKNLHNLCNDAEDYGGMMTEIVVNAP